MQLIMKADMITSGDASVDGWATTDLQILNQLLGGDVLGSSNHLQSTIELLKGDFFCTLCRQQGEQSKC
jgi:hypothetical protein